MAIKSKNKNPMAKDLFTKKYKPKIFNPKKGQGSFNRKKSSYKKTIASRSRQKLIISF